MACMMNDFGGLDGVVQIQGANAVFVDAPKLLNNSYSHSLVDASLYYARSAVLDAVASLQTTNKEIEGDGNERKRKRKKKKNKKSGMCALNEKEVLAELRHQEARCCMLNAHEAFRANVELINLCGTCRSEINNIQPFEDCHRIIVFQDKDEELDLVKLGEVWQAPLYKLTLSLKVDEEPLGDLAEEACKGMQHCTLFNSWIENKRLEEVTGKVTSFNFLIPKDCRFLISDISKIHRLIPELSSNGYNLLVIDPPWENKSVARRAIYPTIPNKQLLRIPLQALIHSDGALITLWLTNRQKLHQFVEQELFPAWGVRLITTWYWLKVTTKGEMISGLDLAHHKPYECLLVGYASQKLQKDTSAMHEDGLSQWIKNLPEKLVVLSVPGDHSRKPPLGLLLSNYAPGPKPVRCLELFARELHARWDSWGNEPLYFQNMKFFKRKPSAN